jgi:type IV secretion system protein VirB2
MRLFTVTCTALLLCLALSESALAQAGGTLRPVESALDFVVRALQGTIARSAAIIAVCALGYLAIVGRITWFFCMSVVLGIAFIFGAATVVDAIRGSVGN